LTAKLTYILILFFLLLRCDLFAQIDSNNAVVRGVVKNSDNEPINEVEISFIKSDKSNEYKVFTDIYGRFSVSLKAGLYEIIANKDGYSKYYRTSLNAVKGDISNLEIILIEKIYTIESIDVEGVFRQSQDDLRTSVFNITPSSIKLMPGSFEDILRSIKSLPGIGSPNDFTSQLIIRGSGPDQNLIIMDDVEIFNPYRLYGIVSMFNPETLSDITLITGGFPSKYGDRLSAVLDVMNREGTTEKNFSLISNINIANANIIVQGKNPLKIPGSWLVSTRRTYYDLILGPFAKKSGLITDDSSFPSFSDLQFKLALGPFKNHKFFLNGIFSKDGVDIIPGKDRKNPDSVNVNDVTYNDVLSLSWHFFPNQNFISKTTLSWYRNNGDNEFDGDILDPLIDKENLSPEQREYLKSIGALFNFKFDSKYFFRKYSLVNRSSLIFYKTKIEFGGGFDLIRTDLKYNLNLDDNFKAYIRSFPNAGALLEDFDIEGNNNYRFNIYLQSRFSAGEKFYYQPSLRMDYYSYLDKIYLSPRINFGYALDPLTTIRLSTGLYFQSPGYEKLVDGQTFFDLTGNGKNLKSERAIHFVLGIDRWLNSEWLLKLEGYYKKFDNLIVQQKTTGYRYQFSLADPNNSDPQYIKNPDNWIRSFTKLPFDSLTTVPVNDGKGYSYGFEISLEKKYITSSTKIYGWINYSLSYAKRERDGLIIPFRFDQRHIVNIVMNYRLLNWLEVGIRWNYASNFPITPPVGLKPRSINDNLVINPLTNDVVFSLDYGEESNRYSDVRPAYHRLDARVSAFTNFWGADWVFYIDVLNVYNRKNVLGYDYYLTGDLQIRRNTVGMIPVLPTIGINARF